MCGNVVVDVKETSTEETSKVFNEKERNHLEWATSGTRRKERR